MKTEHKKKKSCSNINTPERFVCAKYSTSVFIYLGFEWQNDCLNFLQFAIGCLVREFIQFINKYYKKMSIACRIDHTIKKAFAKHFDE